MNTLFYLVEYNYHLSYALNDYALCCSAILMSGPVKEMLVGKALGDAAVTTGLMGVGFKIEHSDKARDYVEHQYSI
jgi:hypothetical protein